MASWRVSSVGKKLYAIVGVCVAGLWVLLAAALVVLYLVAHQD